jgi:DHA1 family bicyclomycin/chloramphenicol resistance-like MFS transporter
MNSNLVVRYLDRTSAPHISTLILLAGISALVMNIFLPSLPAMTQHFGVEYGFMQLSVALYLGVSGFLQLFIGPISDKFGRRRVLLTGVSVFCLATLGCLMAQSGEVFMIFRMLQAVVAVGLVLSRAVIRDIVPDAQAASMIGYVTMGMSLVPMLGPVLGGFLQEHFGWQANFWVLLAAGLFLLALLWADLGETAPKSDNSLIQQFREYPELLASPRFWGYCAAAAFGSGAFFAYLGGSPFVGMNVYNLQPAELGTYFMAPGIGYFIGNFISGRYSARVGINKMVLSGSLIACLGPLIPLSFALAGANDVLIFFGSIVFVGLGNGISLPNANAGMLSVRPHLAGTASGLGGAMMIGGGAALSALAGVLLTPGSTDLPLLTLMMTTCVLSVVAILLVIRRERQLDSL